MHGSFDCAGPFEIEALKSAPNSKNVVVTLRLQLCCARLCLFVFLRLFQPLRFVSSKSGQCFYLTRACIYTQFVFSNCALALLSTSRPKQQLSRPAKNIKMQY